MADDERRSPQDEITNAAASPYRDWFRDLLAGEQRIRARHDAITRILDATGHPITSAQAAILPHLADRCERPAKWILSKAYVGLNSSYNLGILRDRGYLVMRSPDHDKRLRLYRLTDQGAKLAETLKKTLEAAP